MLEFATGEFRHHPVSIDSLSHKVEMGSGVASVRDVLVALAFCESDYTAVVGPRDKSRIY